MARPLNNRVYLNDEEENRETEAKESKVEKE
jgi:hypothetical protein